MKICNQCQAENPDIAEICEACGAQLIAEETAAEEAAAIETEEVLCEETAEDTAEAAETEETAEETPAKPEQKKSKGGLIAIIAAVVVVIVALVVILVQKGKDEVTPPAEDPAAVQEETAEGESAMASLSTGHHTNAYSLPSHSIHYAENDDGTFTYSYLDENGETVTVAQADIDALMAQEVASCAGMTLDNGKVMFYYDDQMYNFMTAYSSYLSFMMNPEQALDEQVGMDGVNTWEQLFVDSGIQMFHQMAAVTAAAQAEGFTLPADQQAAVDAMPQQLEETAATYGYENAEAYLQAYFGPAATLENYLEYYSANVYVNAYLSSIQNGITNTPEELDAYYEENAQMMQETYGIEKVDKNMVSVRHILITPESTTAEDGTTSITDEAWAAAEKEANDIYDEWQNVDPSESYFAGLAAMHTDDPGSQNSGGLYENVYPGQMVPEFNDWCFADGRATGDTGIVKTTYGYHIMFFVEEGDQTYWQMAVNDMLTSQKMSDFIANIRGGQELTADHNAVVLLNKTAPTVPADETEEAAEETAAE